jgi:hypothetical protein
MVMKKFMILLVVGLVLVMGAVQADAKRHKKTDLTGAKFVGTGTFADTAGTVTPLATGDVELDILTQNGIFVNGTFTVNLTGTAVTVPVAGKILKGRLTLSLVGQGILIHVALEHQQTAAVGSFRIVGVGENFPVGLGTFNLLMQ